MKNHLFTFAWAMGIMLSFTTSAAEERSNQLDTPLVGGDFSAGMMFDVVATNNIELNAIAFHTSATTAIDMSVYSRQGTYEGKETDESKWTLVDSKLVDGQGGGKPTYFPFDAPIVLLEGDKRAFYIATTTGPFLRTSTTSATAGDEAYSNNDIIVQVGVGKKLGWDGEVTGSTIFEGVLSYDIYFFPSISPTSSPSSSPSAAPTLSSMPTSSPSATPTMTPSISLQPSTTPTAAPSAFPSASPSAFPSVDLEGLTIRSNVFKAVKDTYIEMGSNKTFGNSSFLLVDGNPNHAALIKFDISSLNGGTEEEPITVYGAKLRLNALRDSEFGGSVSIYYNLDFDEEGANWDSDGNWSDLTETWHVGDLGKVSEGKSYTLDILDAFRKKPLPSTFSVRITSDSDDGVRYRSREGKNGVEKEEFGPRVIFDFAYEPATHAKLAETFGTDSPTQSPTITKTWENNLVPTNATSRYFNYDPSSEYGPDKWRNRKRTTDLDVWQGLRTDHTTNKCGSGSRQSPRDVCGNTKTSCYETHQIRRNSRGDFGFVTGEIHTPTAEIKPYVLSLRFPERRSGYKDEKSERQFPDPPRCDFSRNGYNSGEQPLAFVHVKTKSEHKICGKRYDVELQYYYLHAYGNLEAVSILGEVDEDMDSPNRSFQQILNYFQKKADQDLNACKAKQRRARALFRASKGSGETQMSTLQDESDSMAEQTGSSLRNRSDSEVEEAESSENTPHHDIITRLLNIVDQRELKNQYTFDFYDPDDIWLSEWFIAYDGSTTYPPCSEKVNWRVMDVPFKIHRGQLRQLRNIQFEHVDPNTCRLDSVHYNESNARPIQSYKGGRYYRCTRRHYVPDKERESSGSRGGFSDQNRWTGSDGRPFVRPAEGLSRT